MLLPTEMETAKASSVEASSWWPLSWSDVGMSAVDSLEIVGASLVVAVLGWLVILWKWKPQLALEHFVSWRWLNDETFCITVVVRYSNTSSYRNIRVTQISMKVKRLAELSSDEVAGDNIPDLLPEGIGSREWDKSTAPVLDPGESATDMFNIRVPKATADKLRAFTVYTFIPDSKDSKRGWATLTSHDINNQRGTERGK